MYGCLGIWVDSPAQVARKSHRGVQSAVLPPAGIQSPAPQQPSDLIGQMFQTMLRTLAPMCGGAGAQGSGEPAIQFLGGSAPATPFPPARAAILDRPRLPAAAAADLGTFPQFTDGGEEATPAAAGGNDEEDEEEEDDDDALGKMEKAAGVNKKPAGVKKRPAAKAKAHGKAKAKAKAHSKAKAKTHGCAMAKAKGKGEAYLKAYKAKYKADRAAGYDHLKAMDHAQRAGQRAMKG